MISHLQTKPRNELLSSLQTGLTQFANWVPVCKPGLCGVQSTNWTFKTSSLQTESRSLQTEPVRKLRPTHTGFLRCKWPSTGHGLVIGRRPLMGRAPVRGSPWPPRTCSWQGLQVKSCPPGEIGTSALRHTVKASSDALKPSLIRRAVSTLVYATLLRPAQGLLPMTIHPP